MKKTALCVATIVLAMLAAASAAPAQTPRNSALGDQPVTGSDPYREAVRVFLSGEKPKIVNGQPAPPGAYPWQVSLGVSWIADPVYAHFCGGSVYSARWIVTAAHCVENTLPREIIVTAGTHYLAEGIPSVRRNVARIIVKREFDRASMDNDIALIQLRSDLPLGGTIQPISLLAAGDEPVVLQSNVPLEVVGWGHMQEGGTSVRDLQFVAVPLFDRVTCNRPISYDSRITDNMFCAGATGVDACQGDSGGSLSVDTPTQPRLAGIVSWGEGCARSNKPGVYTRVAKYASWVADCVARPEECR